MRDRSIDNFFEGGYLGSDPKYARFAYDCSLYWADPYIAASNMSHFTLSRHYHERTVELTKWMIDQYGPHSRYGDWHIKEDYGRANIFFVHAKDYILFKLTYS